MKYDKNYSNWKNWDDDNFGYLSKIDKKYFDSEILPIISKFGNKKIKILEIGYGNANFMTYCKVLNIDITGVELNTELIKRAKFNNYKAISYKKFNLHNNKYDLIVAFDVLEHIPANNLTAFFKKISSLLNNQGFLFLRFPNGDSPFGLVNQNGDITHLSAIGSFKIFHLAKISGLNVLKIKPPSQNILNSTILVAVHRLIFNPIKWILNTIVKILMFPDKKIFFFNTNLIALLEKNNAD